MVKACLPDDEAGRVATLHAFGILDTASEREFDDLTQLAAQVCDVPKAFVSFIDTNRIWLKSRVGLELEQAPRDISFCSHAILAPDIFIVPDAREDVRFFDNPFVVGETNVRFYAGVPLVTENGHSVGALCVIDHKPRQLTDNQIAALRTLGRQVMSQLRLRRSVTRLTGTLAALQESERFARSTVDSLSSHMAILNEEGTILAVNRAWREFARANGAKLGAFGEGSNYLKVCDSARGSCSAEAGRVGEAIRQIIGGEREFFELEYPCHAPTERRWFVVRVSKFVGEGPTRVVVAHENVTHRREAQERLRHESLHDALTGLPNRVLFHDRVARCLDRSRREPNYRFAVLFMDLDRFKVVNDSLGHAVGDQLLTTVAARLRDSLRLTDTLTLSAAFDDADARPGESVVARLGGDEFTVLLDGLRDPGDAARVAERLLGAVSQPVKFDGHELETTASIGIVVGGPAYASEKDVLRDADAAMYKAKESGKNRFAIFDETLHAAAVVRLRLESDLRRALERNELFLQYQPILSLQTRELAGFEALIRWRREGQLVRPDEFIPVAEDMGLIVPIGAWVLAEACRQRAKWGLQFPEFAGLTMSVNLSRRQLSDPGLAATLKEVVRTTGVDPATLKLEITESVIMDNPDLARNVLLALKQVGVRLSMDDFGTGYSSLSCLHRIPLDELKIDRSFIADLEGRRDAAAVVNAVIGLAHHLGLVVVAEGLEKMDQAIFLQTMDCDFGQGYMFARPLDPIAAEAFMTERLSTRAVA